MRTPTYLYTISYHVAPNNRSNVAVVLAGLNGCK